MQTTDYGTFNLFGTGCLTVEDIVVAALGEYADDYAVPAIVDEYRENINSLLPEGVTLSGNNIYGPYPIVDVDYPDIYERVTDIFWEIVEDHALESSGIV